MERREGLALAAIRDALERNDDETGVALFVSHHLAELDEAYWRERLGVARPRPEQVLDLLELQSHWSDDDDGGVDVLDFTLPDEVTNYVISVRFDGTGAVEDIAMES